MAKSFYFWKTISKRPNGNPDSQLRGNQTICFHPQSSYFNGFVNKRTPPPMNNKLEKIFCPHSFKAVILTINKIFVWWKQRNSFFEVTKQNKATKWSSSFFSSFCLKKKKDFFCVDNFVLLTSFSNNFKQIPVQSCFDRMVSDAQILLCCQNKMTIHFFRLAKKQQEVILPIFVFFLNFPIFAVKLGCLWTNKKGKFYKMPKLKSKKTFLTKKKVW